jgi:hypothetical protein
MNASEDPREAERWRTYERLCQSHSDLIDDLRKRIRKYAESRDEFTGSEAGQAVLKRWPRRTEWSNLVGNLGLSQANPEGFA